MLRMYRGPPKVKAKDMFRAWKIKRGDTVQVMVGKDKSKQGTVLKVQRKKNTVMVEGCNLVKRHIKAAGGQQGGIATKEAPLHVSNVSLVDPKDSLPTRVRMVLNADGTKVRESKRNGTVIPRPEALLSRKRPKEETEKDTPADEVVQVTYDPTQLSIFATAHLPFLHVPPTNPRPQMPACTTPPPPAA